MFFKLPACVFGAREERACPFCSSMGGFYSSQYSNVECLTLGWIPRPSQSLQAQIWAGWQVVPPLLLPLLILVGRCFSWHVRSPCWVHAAWRTWPLPTCENLGQSQRGGRLSCKTENSPRHDRKDRGDRDMTLQEKNKQLRTENNLQKRRWTERASSSGFELHDGQRKRSASFNTQQGKDVSKKWSQILEIITNLRNDHKS